MREDAGTRYLYLYNCMYTDSDPCAFQVAVEGTGTPYRIDCWNGKMEALGQYQIADGRTVLDVTLEPGEAALYAINTEEDDRSHAVECDADAVRSTETGLEMVAYQSGEYSARLSDGTTVRKRLTVPEDIRLDRWDVVIEDWNEGDKVVISEDRGLGYETEEVYYTTKKTLLPLGETELKPWKEYPQVGEAVSGLGYYSTTFVLPDTWSHQNGALLKIGSTNENTAAVYVNGRKGPAIDFDHPVVDISDFVLPGENELKVEVSSTLNNRLRERRYLEQSIGAFMRRRSMATEPAAQLEEDEEMAEMKRLFRESAQESKALDYGMTGDVSIVTYTAEAIS
jgi:hypothetical protein